MHTTGGILEQKGLKLTVFLLIKSEAHGSVPRSGLSLAQHSELGVVSATLCIIPRGQRCQENVEADGQVPERPALESFPGGPALEIAQNHNEA